MPTLRVHGKTKTGFVSPSRLGWHVMTPPGVAPERRQAQEGGTLPPPRSAQKKIEATLRRSCGLGGGWACVGYIYIHIHIYMEIHICKRRGSSHIILLLRAKMGRRAQSLEAVPRALGTPRLLPTTTTPAVSTSPDHGDAEFSLIFF